MPCWPRRASIAYYVLLAALSIDAKALAAPPITRTIYRGQCTDIACFAPPPLSFESGEVRSARRVDYYLSAEQGGIDKFFTKILAIAKLIGPFRFE